MIRHIKVISTLIFIFLHILVAGQQRVSVGFYNTENLFDTIPSPFYDDSEFTPRGKNNWNTERYNQKIKNIAHVIDDAGFDVLGLVEVENEEVLRSLVSSLRDNYNYIHRTTSDFRGIDIALIYKGDKLFPESIKQISSASSREFLHIRGTLIGNTVNILVCHLPSKLNSSKRRNHTMTRLAYVSDSLQINDPTAKLIIMGDLNAEPTDKIFTTSFGQDNHGYYPTKKLYNALFDATQKGYGSYCWKGKWLLYDNIIISDNFTYKNGLTLLSGGIFVRDYMLTTEKEGISHTQKKGYPLRTFSSGRYTSGYSDHLPVFIILGKNSQ